MSYDIYLTDEQGRVLEADDTHHLYGGTYAVGGTTEMWLNVTYNYGPHYYRVFGERGIRTIYGMTAKDSVTVLTNAINTLGTDVHEDYWEPTEGNARAALLNLLEMAHMHPEGIWKGD